MLLVACAEERASSPARPEPVAAPSVSSTPGALTLVVLGSSTAAGIGPKDPQSAWVERYRRHLSERYPRHQLVNLALGGYTTYHVQATGFEPPTGRPRPDPQRNISAALALRPLAILVNLPSNDVAETIPVGEQLSNYERLAQLAEQARVALWVTTPQPRRLSAEQTAAQTHVRDALAARFVPRVLDFWTPFADERGRIRPELDAGDGVHLNDAAHALLASAVANAQIPASILP